MSGELIFFRNFIYGSAQKYRVGDLMSMDMDGHNVTRLTVNPTGQEWDCAFPKWSPDGSRVLYVSYARRPAIDFSDVYMMAADGSGQLRLTDGPYDNDSPCWSPDGSQIAYMRGHTTGSAIHLMAADGSNDRALTAPGSEDYAPNWSDSGIVFVRRLSPAVSELFLIQSDCTGLRQLTQLGTLVSDPVWSPDASRIAFSARIANPGLGLAEIYSIDAATGTDLQQHTPAGAGHESVCYSPDGTRLALSSDRMGGVFNIFVLDLASSAWTQLTFGTEEDFGVDWR